LNPTFRAAPWSGCWRTGALHFPGITCTIQAVGSRRQHFRCWSTRFGIDEEPGLNSLEKRHGSNDRIVLGYDLFDFAPTDYPDFTLAWRLRSDQRRRGVEDLPAGRRREASYRRRSALGHAYYQTKNEGGGHVLNCHGTGGVYGALLDAVVTKWPEETAE
jgi:hypothetical protein